MENIFGGRLSTSLIYDMDYRNLVYPFKDMADTPYSVVRLLNECYNDYAYGNLGDGEHMASGKQVRGEFLKRIAQMGYDELKYKDIADTLEEDVSENNQHIYHKHYQTLFLLELCLLYYYLLFQYFPPKLYPHNLEYLF